MNVDHVFFGPVATSHVKWDVIADKAQDEISWIGLNDLTRHDDMLNVADADAALAQDQEMIGVNDIFLAPDFISDELDIHPITFGKQTQDNYSNEIEDCQVDVASQANYTVGG